MDAITSTPPPVYLYAQRAAGGQLAALVAAASAALAASVTETDPLQLQSRLPVPDPTLGGHVDAAA